MLLFLQIFGKESMDNPKAVIFGATSSLAQAVARQLCQNRSCTSFYLVARDAEKLETVSRDLHARDAQVELIVSDLNRIESHDELITQIIDADSFWFFYGSLPEQKDAERSWADTASALDTNFTSCASLLARLANDLEARTRPSSIVVVSSVAGDRGRKSNYIYGTAKGALGLFCQGLRNRLASSGVHVMTVKPGFIDTPMTSAIEKKPAFLWATPDRVARQMVVAFEKKKDIVYTPRFWRYVMLIINLIPEAFFKKLSL